MQTGGATAYFGRANNKKTLPHTVAIAFDGRRRSWQQASNGQPLGASKYTLTVTAQVTRIRDTVQCVCGF